MQNLCKFSITLKYLLSYQPYAMEYIQNYNKTELILKGKDCDEIEETDFDID